MNRYRTRAARSGLTNHRTTLCAVVLAMVVLATGCGGGDGDGERDDGETSTEAQPGSPAPTSGDTSERSGRRDGSYCDQARASLAQLNETSLEAAMSPDLAVRQQWFDEQKKLNDELVKAAPAEIRGDLELMVDVTTELGNATFITRDEAAMTAAGNRLGSPEVSAAIERVGRYNENECGIKLGTPGP